MAADWDSWVALEDRTPTNWGYHRDDHLASSDGVRSCPWSRLLQNSLRHFARWVSNVKSALEELVTTVRRYHQPRKSQLDVAVVRVCVR